MFTKGDKPTDELATQPMTPPAQKPARDRSSTVPSFIGADLKIVGDLSREGDIQVDGTVEGNIRSRTVTVIEGAQIQGSISAESVRISGTVSGQIEATSVVISRTAKVVGDIIHQTLEVEAGGYLEGNCRHKAAADKVSALKPVQAKTESSAASGGSSKPAAS
jgi:cytoskeletal protein CcmA (bactofilin family)